MYVKAYKTEVVNGASTKTLVKYTNIDNLTFTIGADLAGTSLPINKFEVDIYTADTIEIGDYAKLYDDNDALWASYWVAYAEHFNAQTLRLLAHSDVGLLDRVTLAPVMYDGAAIGDVLDDTIVRNSGAVGIVTPMDYALDSTLDGVTITGYCPKQSARERLLWVCFTIGAYVKSYFNNQIEILPIDETVTPIPIGDTYWKPSVTYNDWVTAVRAKIYSFTEGTPSTTDPYVTIGETTYIIEESELSLENQNAPSAAPENIVTVDGVYLLNEDNVSGVLTHLAKWYFKRTEVDFDAIDNAAYVPGDKVTVCLDEESMVSGYMNSANFAFGLQSKATIHLTGAENVQAGNLIIVYKYNDVKVSKRVFVFPVGYAYSVDNPYIDMSMNRHRYVFRPVNAQATGTIAAGKNVNNQSCEIALDLFKSVLYIANVDQITATTQGDGENEVTIGVIA